MTGDKVTKGDKSPNVTRSARADLEVTGDTHPLGGVTSVTGARRRKKAPDRVAPALLTTRDTTTEEREEIEVAKARQQSRPRRLALIRSPLRTLSANRYRASDWL